MSPTRAHDPGRPEPSPPSEHQLRAIYESALDAFLIADDEGRYLSANPAACALLGLPEPEIVGRRVADFLPSDVPFEPAWRAFIEQGTQHGELSLRRPDGSVRYAEYNAISNVLPGRHLSILRDVTERKSAEEALKRAEAAKDQFLATLSHELRTPLTPVLALVSRLEDGASLEEMRRGLAVVRKNVELEARLIDDLLDLTRIARGGIELHREVNAVEPLLEHALEVCCAGPVAAGRLRLELDFRADRQGHGPRAWVDETRLTQVFWNLLGNAVKFMPAGGTLRVSTRTEPAAEGEGEVLVVEVADTGVGIEPDLLPRIFDAFEQGRRGSARRQFGGLGLGLAISRTILELHGGTLAAASGGPGKGATFTVRLPLYDLRAELREAPPQTPRTPQTPQIPQKVDGESLPPAAGASREGEGPLSILLVEDHEDTADALATLLRERGHRVLVAGTVATALEAADREAAALDLVISDLGLPDDSGFNLMRRLRERHGLPGIAVSGYGTEEDRRQSREAGFAAHLVKPVTFTGLLAEIQRVPKP